MRVHVLALAAALALPGCIIIEDESSRSGHGSCGEAHDFDCDGLGDQDEENLGCDPQNPDSDQDGLEDGDEVEGGSDPVDPDSDNDGIDDGTEVEQGTDPIDDDSDQDGLDDGEEEGLGCDPSNSDTDGDGLADGSEAIVGGSPYNRTQGELDAFFERLDRFLAFATTELGAVPRTFREFRDAHVGAPA